MAETAEQKTETRGPGIPLRGHERDLAATQQQLQPWLSAKLAAGAPVIITELRAPAGNGVANETLMLEAQWAENGAERRGRFVLRLDTPDAMYMDFRFEDHPRTLQALAGLPGVPVPKLYGYEPDAGIIGRAFYLMERIDGQVPADVPPYNATGFVFDATPQQRHAMWSDAVRVMSRLHRVDRARVAFLDRPQYGDSGLEQLLRYYIASYRWAAQGREQAILETAAQWLLDHLPQDHPTAFAWGDARVGNMIFRDERCVAVLDWDLMSLGGAVSDLGWWLLMDHANSVAFGLQRLPGLGNAAETIALWEEGSGLKARDLDYLIVLAAFRMTVNIMGLARLLKGQGRLPADSRELEEDNFGTHYLAQMLGLTPPTPSKFVWSGLSR
ncbi:MAG: phosphotransferase family protein [Hydrocarboniphaga sp.]|uniref:phosphotransferase family protein n=1 Tax=Hydrocarboniphaga sp. TaxID=2033016 RepID=UPI00261E9737|nr:phosphotransferase family protein [Hydrocarboniphaga sp.]MDB5970623.1 phosphotransferase family protein [Hydrocarboniphaga sp.]